MLPSCDENGGQDAEEKRCSRSIDLLFLVAFFKHKLKVKIKVENERLSSKDFAERWMTVA